MASEQTLQFHHIFVVTPAAFDSHKHNIHLATIATTGHKRAQEIFNRRVSVRKVRIKSFVCDRRLVAIIGTALHNGLFRGMAIVTVI